MSGERVSPIVLAVLKIDNQLEFARLDNWQVSRLLAFEDSPGVDAELSIGIAQVRAIAHQASSLGEVAGRIDRGDGITHCELGELPRLAIEHHILSDHQRGRFELVHPLKDRIEIAWRAGIQDMELQSQPLGRRLQIFRLGISIGVPRIDQQAY